MTAQALLEELREKDIHLEANGLTLQVNAPAETDVDELHATLRKHKRALIRHLEREQKKLQEAHRRRLVIKWSRQPGYIALHDPTTGDWHELPTTDCPPWILEDARAHRRRRRDEK